MPGAPDLGICLARLATLHPRVCPRQVLGVRMALWAGELLQLDLPRADKRVLALVETDGCFADGVSVASGCWFGRRPLRLVDHGKVAFSLADTLVGRTVRVWPHPLARTRARAYAPGAPNSWNAQLTGYQVMPPEELLCSEQVALAFSLDSTFGRPGERVTCAVCGEEVHNDRQVGTPYRPFCRGCAGEPYYSATAAAAPVRQLAAPS